MTAYRYDYDVITQWIEPGEKVLDLGCGDGELLRHLMEVRQVQGYGVENDPDKLLGSVRNGVNVIQMDLEKGLVGLEDGFFDHVIMSLSLQAMHNTQGILREMLRVGREAVVSFPNFGYWRHRQSILNGRMPVSESLPHQWFNTPNVRFFTIADFDALCEINGIAVRERLAFDEGKLVLEEPNFLASVAVYRLGLER
ncbi:methionine biosynthesis protein MetW [Thauera mechernichensis]|uniref:Methionine biosynthesis protein MetW n=1 Tax=Thauera mechernichensis TaxID=82788 RepID=A0ABW3WHK7_9RHOO|nr:MULTISPECIES: methionine biosynthesis protein MetW [Thauera]HAG73930.1 methionine biosynthesis protein MetW [Thauera sp.]ENO82789.1 methionine biosynthesis protein MetW [Thauera sp. 27]ENO93685.1 methionine biosynthesis protein MetW [Thauera sp. 28]MDG3065226.1 methionine biosynthesis protein MetW [Thauera mechernichensis]WBL64219.1 methionine biosynthesis protein MetW [Thauera sp. WB-2]